MRIAVCISGHMRTYRKAFPVLQRQLLYQPGHHFDVFIHTWETMGWFGPNDTNMVDRSTRDEVTYINMSLKPKRLVVEPTKTFEPPPHEIRTNHQVKPGTRGEHICAMYYKILECDKLRQEEEARAGCRYDAVVRLRPDLLFQKRVPMDRLIITGRCLYVNDLGHSGGVNDQLAIASSESMSLVTSCYNHLEDYVNEGCEWRPEPILLHHLLKQELFIKVRPFGISLLRPSGSRWINRGNAIGR